MKVLEKGTKNGWKKEEARSKKQWDNSKIFNVSMVAATC